MMMSQQWLCWNTFNCFRSLEEDVPGKSSKLCSQRFRCFYWTTEDSNFWALKRFRMTGLIKYALFKEILFCWELWGCFDVARMCFRQPMLHAKCWVVAVVAPCKRRDADRHFCRAFNTLHYLACAYFFLIWGLRRLSWIAFGHG